ncbi:MAG: hypothetical protein RMM51_10050, partial [Verrucomicrobiae bacterium]|nr:hypothetical protein [Verrucomicrobiae bacterium]
MKKWFTFVGTLAVLVEFSSTAFSQGTVSATTQFRRTAENDERSAVGDARLRQTPSLQSVDVMIRQLAAESFRIYVTTNANPQFNTNDFVFTVAALDRTNARRGQWQRRLRGQSQAPDELLARFANVADMGGRQLVIARPGPDILVSITNTFGCVTNISAGTTNILCRTNILTGVPLFDPAVTGTVSAVLWAPIPEFLQRPGISNYTRRANLSLPPGIPLSPKATGTIRTRFNNATGQCVFEVRASGLTRGQVYSVWIEDESGTVLLKAGDMKLRGDGAMAYFVRDTRFGDPMPQQVA